MTKSFSFPLPTITNVHLENLYKMHGVDRAVKFELASTSETSETVRGGHLLALIVWARQEGLLFGLDELFHLCLMKQNNQNPGTFLMSPPSMGNFDFSKLLRRWVDDIVHLGSSPMSAKLRGLIGVLRDVVLTVHHSTELVFELRLCFHAERNEFIASKCKRPQSTKAVSSEPLQVELWAQGSKHWEFASPLMDEKEIKNERSEIQRLMEELRAAKEENMKKIGEADRDRDVRGASRASRPEVADNYREVLVSLKERWVSKKREEAAEI
ncbi:hypothetical protein F2Q69_00021462 [Brassica cretica]|uniref:Uncharacterized protein n=1 Tax=Brassica cretica TaxID=69181 RepID=A0A8S9QD93_BRACR|nr:hypothetical protein F2Q69_00021462 [Brassica cretica]